MMMLMIEMTGTMTIAMVDDDDNDDDDDDNDDDDNPDDKDDGDSGCDDRFADVGGDDDNDDKHDCSSSKPWQSSIIKTKTVYGPIPGRSVKGRLSGFKSFPTDRHLLSIGTPPFKGLCKTKQFESFKSKTCGFLDGFEHFGSHIRTPHDKLCI